MVGVVPPGTHDFILLDGVQEVARLPRSVTIEPIAGSRIAAAGTLVHLDRATAEGLAPDGSPGANSLTSIVTLGPPREGQGGQWQRSALIRMSCDPESIDEGCAVGGIRLSQTPPPVVRFIGPAGALLSLAVTDVLPVTPPVTANARVRFTGAAEVLAMVAAGDRDDCLDERAAVVTGSTHRSAATDLDVALRLGVDAGGDGWVYRGRTIKAGAPFTLTTERYVVEGAVLELSTGRAAVSK
jgi:hypothetical protein